MIVARVLVMLMRMEATDGYLEVEDWPRTFEVECILRATIRRQWTEIERLIEKMREMGIS
jgi:hypothetical protein